MNLRTALSQKKFIITAELSPPRGVNTEDAVNIGRLIKGRVDGINVTDNQRAIMRMSSLAFSHLLYEEGIDPVLQICCRDKNRIALQSELLGAYSLGIKNISVMTGDHPKIGDHPGAKPVFDVDSIQLIKIISGLRDGKTLSGKDVDRIDFCVGGVANPFSEPFELQLIKIKKKADSGADFFQTQPMFDIREVELFLNKVKDIRAKFLIGVTPLKSLKMIEFMEKNVLLRPIPDMLKYRLTNSTNYEEESINIASEFINSLKNIASGVHIMPIGVDRYLPKILDRLK